MNRQPSKQGFSAAAIGTVAIAICCFTSILVVTLGTVGLSALTPYLDYVLWPTLVLLFLVTILAYRKWKHYS
ncbi:mercury transporter [Candidatus Peregrinibacteria bacterium CG10_big_fil_rev_8_21_14_0_10_49_24]|nr:MAG: mercury transporter [Candidatus Peregrinibacteria bacterium CG11_big_fil_rev_8_21_14_0_20_49_14]PIR51663.1 MAG: mercury transporter [Candidatus Peregrinibacteria bacterium CG10_big_fil_rev_8_21_14_0_10_49_24]PJA67977.1 MAG: mercury transporter [Candidatus Peregrinibacteria bacterium CG_4_9_14_3_um_filter_49_12]